MDWRIRFAGSRENASAGFAGGACSCISLESMGRVSKPSPPPHPGGWGGGGGVEGGFLETMIFG